MLTFYMSSGGKDYLGMYLQTTFVGRCDTDDLLSIVSLMRPAARTAED